MEIVFGPSKPKESQITGLIVHPSPESCSFKSCGSKYNIHIRKIKRNKTPRKKIIAFKNKSKDVIIHTKFRCSGEFLASGLKEKGNFKLIVQVHPGLKSPSFPDLWPDLDTTPYV